MKRENYEKKLKGLSNAEQFNERKNLTDSVIKKMKKTNKDLFTMNKREEISEALHTRLRSTRAELARLYGLVKMHKQGTSVHPLNSLPISSYDHLNETLAEYFDKIEGANIETNTQLAR